MKGKFGVDEIVVTVNEVPVSASRCKSATR